LQVFFERKIIGHLYGKEVEEFHAATGLDSLRSTVLDLGESNPYTALVPQLEGVDPDDSFSRIPYEKGFYFLRYLEGLVGEVLAFKAFTKAYLETFGRSTCTTDQFKTHFVDHFRDCEAVKSIDWDTWLYAPGKPCNLYRFVYFKLQRAVD
jgi:leukotriene-A4 hydrolase